MTTRHKIIFLGLLAIMISIIAYTPIRTGMIETSYQKSMIAASHKISLSLEHFEKDRKVKDKDLTKFFMAVKKQYKNIALIAISDNKNSVLMAGKNEKYIDSMTLFDSIIDTFTNGDFKIDRNNDFIIRYFNQKRFYVFVRFVNNAKMLMIFPYKIGANIIIQLILEILLITTLLVIITSLIYIKQKRKEAPYNVTHKKIISKLKREKHIHRNDSEISEKISDSAYGFLNKYVFEFFEHLKTEYRPENVSLYLKNKETSTLEKMFELEGETFIKAKGSGIGTMDIDEDVVEELTKSSIFIQDKGKKITFPLLYKKNLIGIIKIVREKEIIGPEVKGIKSQLQLIVKPISQYLMLD